MRCVCVTETNVPGKPTSLRLRPLTTSIVVSWTPPVEQDIMIRGYVLGYGIGIPDVYRQIVPSRQRYYAVKSLRETIQITACLYVRLYLCQYFKHFTKVSEVSIISKENLTFLFTRTSSTVQCLFCHPAGQYGP